MFLKISHNGEEYTVNRLSGTVYKNGKIVVRKPELCKELKNQALEIIKEELK